MPVIADYLGLAAAEVAWLIDAGKIDPSDWTSVVRYRAGDAQAEVDRLAREARDALAVRQAATPTRPSRLDLYRESGYRG